ncbi:MAG: hypothetical protein P8X55_18375 [Desulfosarcinaceae bacterium]
MNNEKQQIYDLLYEIVGQGGCGVACSEAEIYEEDGQWKMFLEGFMEPWPLGHTIEEVKANLEEYANQGFGLG